MSNRTLFEMMSESSGSMHGIVVMLENVIFIWKGFIQILGDQNIVDQACIGRSHEPFLQPDERTKAIPTHGIPNIHRAPATSKHLMSICAVIPRKDKVFNKTGLKGTNFFYKLAGKITYVSFLFEHGLVTEFR